MASESFLAPLMGIFHFFSGSPKMNPVGVPSMQYFADSPYWEARGELGPMEWSAGNGFLAQTGTSSGAGSFERTLDQTRPARFADVRVHPFGKAYRWEAIAVQLGLMQTGEETASSQWRATSTGYYAGFQADLLELARKERDSLQIRVGAGVTNIQPPDRSFRSLPYASLEVGYQIHGRVEAKAAFLASPFPGSFDWGIAAPALKVEIRL